MRNTKNILLITLIMACVFLGTREITPAYGSSYGAKVDTIQQGTNTESVAAATVDTVDVTITAVVLAKSEVQAWAVSNTNNAAVATIAPVLTSTTNLRLFMTTGDADDTKTVTYTWQVVEHY